ncbi:DUF6525 family protein [Cognatiyoonia sp. IB215446]|uniref:DUF6525 family protein n=1 Tax=Cognatiyoonia sp. IB215446 TaxID=3097355 RepID=UPI002A0D5D6C|nr:DUF6525 family protein [Cognatiyoonia sp. IB215446]MDX8350219.1 DUF6525 family protein [Cognatiyoonia sp. IB215446]
MSRNLGATTLRRKRRAADPMRSYDSLPAPLRHWLSQAALPWSPASARKLWNRARAEGLSTDDALQALSLAEQNTLRRDRYALTPSLGQNVGDPVR